MKAASELFRGELLLALGWSDAPLTLRALAALLECTVSRARYHAEALAAGGSLRLSKDAQGRVLVGTSSDSVHVGSVQESEHGLVRRCLDGSVVRPATADDVARSERTARRELQRHSGAPEPGLGVIYAGGFRCWVEPPVLLVA